MGFRSHVGGEFSSSSSCLFPLAPPFGVERSVFNPTSDPVVDFPETPFTMAFSGSLHSSGSGTFGQEFFPNPVLELNRSLNPSSETHEYLSGKAAASANTNLPPLSPAVTASKDPFLLGQCCYTVPANSVEAIPYYPKYFSPATHRDNSLVSPNDSWSAYQSATLDGSSHLIYAKKSIHSNPTPEWRGWTDEWRNGWSDWNQGKGKATDLFGSLSLNETDVTCSPTYENLSSKGGGYYDTQALSNNTEFFNSNSINMYGGKKPTMTVRAHQPYDKSFLGNDCFSLQADLSIQTQPVVASELPADSGNHQMSYNASCSKHLSQGDQPYTYITGSSGDKTGMLNDLNVGSAAEHTDFRCSSSFNTNIPSSLQSFENPAFLNSSENDIHLEKNRFTSSGNGSDASNKVVSKDSLAHTFLQNYEHYISHTSTDFLSLAMNTNRSVSSAEKSFDTVDRNNAAVDSPCWKGAPTSQCFPIEASDIVSAFVKKDEEYRGYNDQVTHSFLFGTEDALQSCSTNRKKNAMNDENKHLEDSLAASMGSSMISFASEESISDRKMKVGSCSRIQFPMDIHERTAVHPAASNVAEDFDLEYLTPEQQSSVKLKITNEEKHSPNYYPADTGIKECSHSESIKIHATKCALSSPSSPKKVLTRCAESVLEESCPKIDVRILVNTMHSLSEMLSFHCLNGPSELKEHDQNLLKSVISNIDACFLMNAKQIAPEKERAFYQTDTLQFVEASVEDQQIKISGGLHLPKEMSEFSQTKHGTLNVDEVTEQYCKFHDSIADSLSARYAAKTMKEDNMTKELKRILDENFDNEEITEPQAFLYRNLWLEAEATLCSINYKARFNRIKNEMEKRSHQLEENTGGTKNLPNPGVLLHSGEESGRPTEAKNDLCHEPSSQNAPPSNTTKHVNDVQLRFHILKIREDDSYIKDSNEEESSDCTSSGDQDKADEPIDLEKGSEKPVDLFMDSLFSGCEDTIVDVEGSVMARFNNLKSRADHFSVAKNDWPLMTNIGEDEMVDAKMDKITVLQGSYMVDKVSAPQEPYIHVEEEQGSQSFVVNHFGLRLVSSCYDGTSSDWEHVTDEEFTGEQEHY